MRRYTVEVGGKTHVIDVEETARDTFEVHVGEKEFKVRLASAHDVAEAVISPEIAPAEPDEDALSPAEPYRPAAPETLPPLLQATLPALAAQPHLPDDGFRPELAAPMPGTIVCVHVAVGDRVTAGQVVVKLKAMKMTNAVKAPQDAVVAEVRAQAGQAVGYGDVLVVSKEA
jgi:glutaconyl-CoA/methylmalonyl-CoA decarboxylase subunit gamma